MILENDVLRVEIHSFGAEIRGIFDKVNQRELMWSGDSSWWSRVSPVLFPIVGGLRDKKYRHDGVEYEMSQHGFLRDNEMSCIRQSETEVWYGFVANEETKRVYPFDFVVEIGYELLENTVLVKWRVKNNGDEPMYFSIGAHPAFLAEEGDRFIIESNGITNRYPLVLGGVGDPYQEDVEVVEIHPSIFVHDALIYDNTRATTLVTKRADIKVTYDNFMYVGLWSTLKDGIMAPFVCIEPWIGIADFADFEGELRNKTGMVKLGAKSENAYMYSIEVTTK